MKSFTIISVTFMVGFAVALSSCGGESGPKKPAYDYERSDSLSKDYLNELSTIRSTIESSASLFNKLNENGYSFDEGDMLSSGKGSSMSTSKKQALALGAFGSDMVYTSSFGQTQSSLNYLQSINGLSGKLGIQSAFDEKLMEKLSSEDSTVNKSVLLTQAYIKAKDNLFSDDRAKIATMMAVGGWIESMHLASTMLANKMDGNIPRTEYWELADSYKSLLKMCQVFENDADIKSLVTSLDEIRTPVAKIYSNSRKYSVKDVKAAQEALQALRSQIIG